MAKTMIELLVKGQESRKYHVNIEGKKQVVAAGEKVKVSNKEEADRLLKVREATGKLLFSLIGGGADGAKNNEGSK